MKNIAFSFMILVLVGVFVTTSVLAAEEPVYKISAIKGKVLLKRAGTQDWIEAKAGDVLYANDALKTLEDGSAFLETGPNTGFTIGSNSELVVANTVEPPVAEPYSEPIAEVSADSVVAPEASRDANASGY